MIERGEVNNVEKTVIFIADELGVVREKIMSQKNVVEGNTGAIGNSLEGTMVEKMGGASRRSATG